MVRFMILSRAPMTHPDRIQGTQVRGVWPPLLLHWHDDWSLDEQAFEHNLRHVAEQEPHGLYTLDTASEFYTLEFAEWEAISHRFVRGCERLGVTLPIGLGCTWTNQPGALERVRAARDLGVQTIHLSPPYWLPLNDDALCGFYAAVNEVAGHLGVIIYAPPWSGVHLTADLYRRLVNEAPCIIGTKGPATDHALLNAIEGHSHFAQEQRIVQASKHGAIGCYSALAGVSIPFMKAWWDMIERDDHAAAAQRDEAVQRFYAQGVQPVRDRGILAGAIDKAMARIGGQIGSRALRPPYPAVPDDLFDQMETAARTHILA